MHNQTYKTITDTNAYKSDSNCCAVVATSVAFNIDFKEAQSLYDNAGRRRNGGTSNYVISKVVYQLKLSQAVNVTSEYPSDYMSKTMTANNCVNYLDDTCNYIALTATHAIGINKGVVEDWTQGRRHKIKSLYKVTPKLLQAVKVATVTDSLKALNELMSQF